MTSTRDPVLEPELDAYVDGQLDDRRRIEIEAHLAANPALASRVMADLRVSDELRLAFSAEPAGGASDGTRRLGRKLEHALRWTRVMVHARRAAVIVVLLASGWLANAYVGPLLVGTVIAYPQAPAYVSDAVMAHRTASLRGAMRSQVETPDYDPDEIRAATAIVLPKLPKDWSVLDVQLFPSKFGPSLQMAVRTDDLGLVSLYAVRPGSYDLEPASGKEVDGMAAAYWQVGEVAYALVAESDLPKLLHRAGRLAGRLNPTLKPSRQGAAW